MAGKVFTGYKREREKGTQHAPERNTAIPGDPINSPLTLQMNEPANRCASHLVPPHNRVPLQLPESAGRVGANKKGSHPPESE